MKTLVTGSSGFLGRFLCKALRAQGHEIVEARTLNCDLTQDKSLQQFNKIIFDRIYHLAAWTQAGDFCLHYPGDQWLINQKINTNVLTWWKESQPQAKMIAIGTSCAYDPQYPLEEDYFIKGVPIESLLSYGMTKKMLLAGLISLNKQFGLDYLYLIPSTLYGPEYYIEGKVPHFVFDLIRKILRGSLYGDPVVLWGDGHQKRELVYIEDFIRSMLALSGSQKNTIINIGGGKEYSIREFAQIICEQVGYPFDTIQFDLNRYVGARSKVLSIQKFKSMLPDFNPISLEIGLKNTIDWFLEHRDQLEPYNQYANL